MQNTKTEGPAENAAISKENSFLIKIHGDIVASIEDRYLDIVLEDGELYLDIKKYRSFFEGQRANKEMLKEALEHAKKQGGSANLIGLPAELAVELGFAHKKEIRYINNIALLQIYWV